MDGRGQILSQTSVEHCPLQRSVVVTGQVVGQHGGGVDPLPVVKAAQRGAAGDDGSLRGGLLLADLIGNLPCDSRHGLLHEDLKGNRTAVKHPQETVDFSQCCVRIHTAHQREAQGSMFVENIDGHIANVEEDGCTWLPMDTNKEQITGSLDEITLHGDDTIYLQYYVVPYFDYLPYRTRNLPVGR